MTNPLSFDDLQGIIHRHIDQLPDNRQGQNNAHTLLGMEQIPCDDQVRNLLDPLAPSALDPVFVEIFQGLEQHRKFASLRGFGD